MIKIAAALIICCLFASGAAASSLEEGFEKPPAEARPLTWWHWINGNISKEGIRADLRAMKKTGLAGCQILDVSEQVVPLAVRAKK